MCSQVWGTCVEDLAYHHQPEPHPVSTQYWLIGYGTRTHVYGQHGRSKTPPLSTPHTIRSCWGTRRDILLLEKAPHWPVPVWWFIPGQLVPARCDNKQKTGGRLRSNKIKARFAGAEDRLPRVPRTQCETDGQHKHHSVEDVPWAGCPGYQHRVCGNVRRKTERRAAAVAARKPRYRPAISSRGYKKQPLSHQRPAC